MKHVLGITLITLLTATAAVADGRLDLNTAGVEQLAAMLDGVGEARAEAIVEYREGNGGFASVDELTEVSGIGEVTLEQNRDLLSVSEQ